MNRQLEETLVEALDLLEQGTPVAEIMSRYPEMAGELQPFLLTAVELDRLAQPASTASEQASKNELLRYAESLKSERRKPTPAVAWFRQVLTSTIAVLFLLIACGTIIGAASTGAVPGDVLYGSKLLLEEVRLNYSPNPGAAATMLEEFRQERINEVKALLSAGREEPVQFSGEIEALSQDRWVVAGIPVSIVPSAIVHESVEVGFLVQIIGRTSDGLVLAEEIDVYGAQLPKPDQVDPIPTAEPSPSPSPTSTPFNTPQQPDSVQPDEGPDSALFTPEPSPSATPAGDLPNDDSAEHSSGETGEDNNSPGQEEEPAQDDSSDNSEDGSNPDDEAESHDDSSEQDRENSSEDNDREESDGQNSDDEGESHDDGEETGEDHQNDGDASSEGEQSDDDESTRQEDA